MPATTTLKGLLFAAVAGLVLGLVTQIGQSILPDGLGQAANSISPWLTVAFFVGATFERPSTAAVAGFITLALALVGYYALVYIRFGYTGSSTALILWTVGAICGGLVFGLAGWFWRNGSSTAHLVAVALLAAAYVCEGIYLILILPNALIGAAFICVGIALPLLLAAKGERLRAELAMVPAIGLGGLGFVAVFVLTDLLLRL